MFIPTISGNLNGPFVVISDFKTEVLDILFI